MPGRIVQYRGWRYLNLICVHAVPRGNLRSCINAPDGGLLWQLCIWILLPYRLRVREWRDGCYDVRYGDRDLRRGVLLSCRINDKSG